jgi:tetratricopeptide (TPR) repeat protein
MATHAHVALRDAGSAAATEGGGRGRVAVRRELGIDSFGVNAFFQAKSGGPVINEHDELGPGASGHEELYAVVQGGCTFTIDGDEVDAPHGSSIFVGPAAKRSAIATEDETLVLVVGGRPGEPYRPGPGEALAPMFAHYNAGDYGKALEICREVLTRYPGNAFVLYNVACVASRLGDPEAALDALGESLAAWPEYKELAAADDDLAALRDDPRFQALVR